MKVLITGVNGFIGASYASMLSSPSNYIVGTDMQAEENLKRSNEYFSIDLGSDKGRDALTRLPPVDAILHAGGISGFMVETNNPQRIFDVNIAGTMAVLELARRHKCRRLILCSTIMVYGPDSELGAEHGEAEYLIPMSVYGGSKVAMEGLMHAFRGQYGVDAIALRFSHVYGPGRTTECFVRDMLKASADQKPCRISQTSHSLRQYVHIRDVCQSIDLAMRAKELPSHVFNISGDEIHTLAELSNIVRQVTGALDVSFDEQRDLPNYRIGKLSIQSARELLGYEPQLSLRKGVEDYWTSSFRPAAKRSVNAGHI